MLIISAGAYVKSIVVQCDQIHYHTRRNQLLPIRERLTIYCSFLLLYLPHGGGGEGGVEMNHYLPCWK